MGLPTLLSSTSQTSAGHSGEGNALSSLQSTAHRIIRSKSLLFVFNICQRSSPSPGEECAATEDSSLGGRGVAEHARRLLADMHHLVNITRDAAQRDSAAASLHEPEYYLL